MMMYVYPPKPRIRKEGKVWIASCNGLHGVGPTAMEAWLSLKSAEWKVEGARIYPQIVPHQPMWEPVLPYWQPPVPPTAADPGAPNWTTCFVGNTAVN